MADTPAAEEIRKWNKWFAAECNNRAWRLAEQPSRTPAEDQEMVHCAHAAALHWSKVGTALHQAPAANDERSLHNTHYARAKVLGAALTDDEERAIFEATFRTVPAP